MAINRLLIGILLLIIPSCQDKDDRQLFCYPCVPVPFCINGVFSIDLPNMKPTNVKEVRLDIRTPVSDNFRILIKGKEPCLYLVMDYKEAIRTDLMPWIVSDSDCLNVLEGCVNEKMEGFINIIYWK